MQIEPKADSGRRANKKHLEEGTVNLYLSPWYKESPEQMRCDKELKKRLRTLHKDTNTKKSKENEVTSWQTD